MSGAAAGDKSLPFSSAVLYEPHASAEGTSRFMCRVQQKVLLERCLNEERLTVMLMVAVALSAACYPLRIYVPVTPPVPAQWTLHLISVSVWCYVTVHVHNFV